MMVQRVFGLDVRNRPVVTGLLWAALTASLMVAIMTMMGERFPVVRLMVLVAVFVPAGLAWGYATRWFTLREDARAR